MISRAVVIVSTRNSVPLIRRGGQRSMEYRTMVASAAGIIRLASGSTMRLVSRKCCGKEWK